jgi:hypothetical protein
VRGGHPLTELGGADHVADTLLDAVDWLLARAPQGT